LFASSWLILLFPLLGFIGLSWYGNRISKNLAGLVGCGTVGASFFMTLVTLSNLLFLPTEERVGQVQTLYNWISAGSFKLDLAILIDPLSVFMFLVVTGVGFVIHVYSIGYMHDDPEYSRFFSYLNLFIFSMLVLVAAADFFFLIVGWALVGLASYLLIGFWREKTSAVLAARKAFVMNVIGDVENKDCIIVDDIADTAGTLCNAASALKENGATKVYAYIVHPVLSGNAIEKISKSKLDQLVVTDTIPLSEEAQACKRIRIISMAPTLAEAIRRVNNEESISAMFL